MTDSDSGMSRWRGAPFTAGFMALCIALFVIGMVSPALQRGIFFRFSQINIAVAAGEWWRLFTSACLHAGIAHIAFNMWALLQLGPPLERRVGTAAFATMCLAAAAWSGAAAYLLTGPRSSLVGASGVIFGVFGVWLYASYMTRETPMGQGQFRSLLSLLAINAFLSFTVPRISWQGHAGGLAAGLAVAAIWRHLPQPRTEMRRCVAAVVIAVLAVAVVFLKQVEPAFLPSDTGSMLRRMDDTVKDQTSFTRMEDATAQDYQVVARHSIRFMAGLPNRILSHLKLLAGDTGGYAVDRLTHSLQTATRAQRDGRDEEYVACALVHDIGDTVASFNHSDLAAAIVKPFVSEQNHWIVQQHAVFQGYFFFHHIGLDRHMRDRFRDHRWWQDCADFCEVYDQNSFDPNYDTLPLAFFIPIVERVFATPKRSIYFPSEESAA